MSSALWEPLVIRFQNAFYTTIVLSSYIKLSNCSSEKESLILFSASCNLCPALPGFCILENHSVCKTMEMSTRRDIGKIRNSSLFVLHYAISMIILQFRMVSRLFKWLQWTEGRSSKALTINCFWALVCKWSSGGRQCELFGYYTCFRVSNLVCRELKRDLMHFSVCRLMRWHIRNVYENLRNVEAGRCPEQDG